METDRKILLTDREYPRRLLEIPQAPKQLYVRGKLPEEGVPSVAVIGARDCSYYGQEVAKRLGRLFGENGIQVISGMARGIDGIGQQAALQAAVPLRYWDVGRISAIPGRIRICMTGFANRVV